MPARRPAQDHVQCYIQVHVCVVRATWIEHLDLSIPVISMATASLTIATSDEQASVSATGELEAEEAASPNAPLTFEEGDPNDPKNRSKRLRWTLTIVLSCFTPISPMSSSMVALALDAIEQDLAISSPFRKQLVLSIFVLFYEIGPMFLGPLSEQYGEHRRIGLCGCSYSRC